MDMVRQSIASAYSKGAFHLLFAVGILHGINFGMQIFLARYLGPDDMGHIAIMRTWLNFASLVSTMGLTTALVKYVSSAPDEESRRKFLYHGIVLTGFISIATMLVVLAVTFFTPWITDEVANREMRVMCLSLPFGAIYSLLVCYFLGIKQMIRRAKLDLNVGWISALATISATCAWKLRGYVASVAIFAAAGAGALLHALRDHLRAFTWERKLAVDLFTFGLWGFLANVASQAVSAVSVLMLSAAISDPAVVGHYSVAVMLTSAFHLIFNPLYDTAFPYMSERGHDLDACRKIYKSLLMKFFLLSSALCAGGFLFGGMGIRLVFGEQYETSIAPFNILLVGFLFMALGNVGSHMLLAMSKPKANFYIMLLDGGASVVLNMYLIEKMGIVGAAWATAIAYFLRFVMNTLVIRRMLFSK